MPTSGFPTAKSPLSDLDSEIHRFEEDRHSGSSQLARLAIQLLTDARRCGLDGDAVEALRDRLARAHPTMAAVWNAAHAQDPERFRSDMRTNWQRAAAQARRLLPRSGVIVTLSYSATVLEALGGTTARIVVAESLPGGEGARTVEALKRTGTDATVVSDATLGQWAAAADAVVIGADAVTPRGVINKVGSRLLALAAKVERTPFHAVADTSKFTLPPSTFPLPLLGPDDRFEYVELELVERVVSEQGARKGRLVARRLAK
jgi:translation initiation factor 2B subunit (eIF-2B alpha/beta/delta family)